MPCRFVDVWVALTSVTALTSFGCIAEHPDVDGTSGGSGAGVGTGGGELGGSASGGAGSGANCLARGAGRIDIQIVGLPEGVDANLILTGPLGARALAASTVIEGIAAGPYTVAPVRVSDFDPIVRTVYEYADLETEFCVVDSATRTVSINYHAVPTSHRLWTNNSNGDGNLLGFSGENLALTTSAAPDVSALAAAGKDVTFDAEGNLWSMGATLADPHLMRFSRSELGVSGEKTPDRSVTIAAVPCLPAMRAFAFDREGALWVSECGGQIVKLSPAELEATSEVTPGVVISGLNDNGDVAFDIVGNLWATDGDRVLRYDAERLGASSVSTPDRSMTLRASAEGPNLAPSNLAFDRAGDLWVIDFGGNLLARIALIDLEGTGSYDVIARTSIALSVSALLERPALDESGGLWLSLDQNRFGRLSAEQLLVSSTPGAPTTPETIITSPSMGNANRMAFYPAPLDLPLYHRFP